MTQTFIVTGPPGAGKSTLSSYLAESFELGIHIHCDDIYNMVKGGYKYPWEDTDGFLMDTMFQASIQLQKIYANNKFECVIDYVFHFDQLRNFISKISTPINLTVLLPNCSTNIKRDASRKHTIGEQRVTYYHNYFNKFSSSLNDFLIDNSSLSIEDTAEKMLSAKTHSSSELLEILNNYYS